MIRFVFFLTAWIVIDACIDRIDIEVQGSTLGDIVVDGLITNEPGPYTVKLNSVIRIDDTHPLGVPLTALKVTISDDTGNSEVLEQTSNGVYQTSPVGIQGVVGRSYYVRVEMSDGSVFQSEPDRLGEVGKVDSIYYDFETYTGDLGKPAYRYRIFMDATAATGDEKFYRWKFNGTYVVRTEPRFTHCTDRPPPCQWCPAPCSGAAATGDGPEPKEGYAYNPVTNKVEYVIGLHCTCCRCWVTAPENKPRVTDTRLSSNGKFLKVEMGTVPVNFYTFYEKYRVEVVQMSLSRAAFDYWHGIQVQKEGVGSLFQPVTGKIPTNIVNVNGNKSAFGIFYASSVTKKQVYLDQRTARIPEIDIPEDDCNGVLRSGPIGMDCRTAFPGSASTNVKPADWVD